MDDLDLGTDIKVLPDLDEDETLVEGMECLKQDLLLRLDQPTGLPDLTDDGAVYGYDLSANVNESMTPRQILEIRAAVEVQCESDDRIDRASAAATFNAEMQSLTITLDLQVGAAPHTLTLQVSPDNVGLLQVADGD